MACVCVLLAEGFEEIEAITIIDVLRRADIETVIAGVTGTEVEGSHGIRVTADVTLDAASGRPWDLLVLPGGMPGAANLRDDARVQAMLRAQRERGGRIAAICAAPIALARAGVLEGRAATSFPGFEDQLGNVSYRSDPVVVDDGIITSRGPGMALPFALELVGQLRDRDAVVALADRMLTSPPQ